MMAAHLVSRFVDMLMLTQLCGFGAGQNTLTTIVQQASATSTAATINCPADIIAGDLLVMLDRASNNAFGGVPASVTPSGFTSIGNISVSASGITGIRQTFWYKLAVGTEASSTLTGMDGTATDKKALLVFRGNVPATTLTLVSVGGEATDGNPTAQNVTAGTGVPPLVVLGGYGSQSAVSPRTFSTTKDGEINPDTLLYLAWKIYNSAPADSSIDMDDEGTGNTLQSCYIQMA